MMGSFKEALAWGGGWREGSSQQRGQSVKSSELGGRMVSSNTQKKSSMSDGCRVKSVGLEESQNMERQL